MKKVLIILLALVLAGGGVYWFFFRDGSVKVETETPKPLTTANMIKATIITYTDDGFSPAEYLGSGGGSLTVQNDSSSDLDFQSDELPDKTKNSELNVGLVQPGESKTVELSTAGAWGFRNHNNPTHTGKITIE